MIRRTFQGAALDSFSLRVIVSALIVLTATALLVTACGGNDQEQTDKAEVAQPSEAEHMHADEQEEADHHHGEHEDSDNHHSGNEDMMSEHHDIPAEADAMANPVAATEESVATGAVLYAANCAVCHGDTGEGNGPSAAGLEPKPANLHEEHVQELTDGALFHIITHGRSGTGMPAWEGVLGEDERWHVVNFLRTFKE